MNSTPHNANSSASDSGSGEETLRLMAKLPAPTGLENRVHAALRAAPERDPRRRSFAAGVSRRGRVLAWPTVLTPQSSWMRTAAAAAIVFVVAGGGWGVYTRVEQSQPAKVIVMPPRVVTSGGFSGAGAIRTPDTVPGPILVQPAMPKVAQPEPAQPEAVRPKAAKKPVAKLTPKSAVANHPSAASTPAAPR